MFPCHWRHDCSPEVIFFLSTEPFHLDKFRQTRNFEMAPMKTVQSQD